MLWLILIQMLVAGGKPDAAYIASWEKWKAGVANDLRTNWVPLAGLFWLKPGPNTFGSGSTNDVVLPEGTAPSRAGTFELSGIEVTVQATGGVTISIGGKPVARAKLAADTGGSPTVLELGHLRMHVIVRGERVGIRAKDLESPALKDLQLPVFFPADLRYRVTARWVPSGGKTTVDVPNVLGDVTATPVPGEARFTIEGKECTLMATGGSENEELFFVFSDTTSRTGTYPSGRFLYAGPVVNGTVVLDFNRAHNPPCAVTAFATCPLPPARNRLVVAIPAEESSTGGRDIEGRGHNPSVKCGGSTPIDIGRPSRAVPVTPPCVRVRTRRFG